LEGLIKRFHSRSGAIWRKRKTYLKNQELSRKKIPAIVSERKSSDIKACKQPRQFLGAPERNQYF